MSESQLGHRIAHLRGGLSQAEFAEKMDVSRNTLSRYENGTRVPDALFLQKLAVSYGVDANWLLFGDTPPPTPELNAREAILVDHYRNCDETGRDAMLRTGAALAQPHKTLKKAE